MEISNNRIKVTSMKTFAKFFLHFSLVMLSCLTAGCTSEVETIGGTPETPENPQANDPNRRSVVISLQNKLILVNGTPESRTITRDGIAEEDENRIESFDIYAFGSDKEEGPYTFQERFAYRSDARTLPAGTSPLELKADEAAGKINVVFYPRKGLFTKFYCVANQTEMNDATGRAYTNYVPLQQGSQSQSGASGDAVTAPGTPTENDFVKLNTPLLNLNGFNTDILLAPLPMSGANSQPTDLREYSMGTYVRLNVSLTRAVARFDIVNDAAKSHFTITDISMGNGRQGVTLFPIRPLGGVPAATGQLIMYPYRLFDGLNANAGTTTKAFYCYPCKAIDAGYLILKGLYAVNLTDEKKEVTYRIPFERVTDGNGSLIEINHNHRYTVQITEADPFELQANIRLVDWETGNDVEDYEPDNGLDAIAISDMLPDGETIYDANTGSITLPVKAGSSFVVTVGSNAGIEARLGYQSGTPAGGWLKLEEIPVSTTRADGTKQAKFKVSVNEDYAGDNYPRGVVRLTDKAGGGEEVVLVNIDNTPLVKPTVDTMIPEGINNWDASEQTLYMVQTAAGKKSTGTITVISQNGSKIELPEGSGITVSPTSSTNTTQKYTFSWAGTDATDLTEKEIAVTLKNDMDETKTGSIKVKLLPNKINNLQLANAGDGISLSGVAATTATLTMPIIKDRQFTITMDSYSKPTVKKYPAWLKNITPAATRGTPESKTTDFIFKLNEDADDFSDTQIVFDNAAGGTGMTVNVTKEHQKPTITFVSSDPTINSYSSGTLNLYQLKSTYYSTVTLKVYSLGGSKLQLPAGVEAELTQSDAKEQNYVIKYKITSDSNFSLNDISGGTLYVKNLSDESKSETIPVTFKSSLPTVSSSAGISFTRAVSDVDVTINAHLETGGRTGFAFTFTSPAGYNAPTNPSEYTEVSSGSQSGNAGSIKNIININFKNTATFSNNPNLYYYTLTAKDARFPDYKIDLYMKILVCQGKTAYRLNGFWVMPYRGPNTPSNADADVSNVGNGWRMPSMSEYRTLAQNSHADSDYMKRIFDIGKQHYSADAQAMFRKTFTVSYSMDISESQSSTKMYPYLIIHD